MALDPDIFAAEAHDLYVRLAKAVAAFCGDASLAEDSAQEALLRAWQRVERGESFGSIEAWTMTVAFNWCRSQMRRSSVQARAKDRLDHDAGLFSANEVETVVAQRALTDEIREAVLALPDRQRQVIVLHYLADMGIAAIAEVTETSDGAVKNALFNGRDSLRVALGRTHSADGATNDSRIIEREAES